MKVCHNNDNMIIKGMSLIFSRKAFSQMMEYNDYSYIREVLQYYGFSDMLKLSVMNIFKKSYSYMVKDYRCEYVYKNELLNRVILKEYGTKHSIVFNEFKVGHSIADMALFNGESKAFEIKSDLDSSFRLSKQMLDYTRLFQRSYVVIPEEKVDSYSSSISDSIGIIVMSNVKKHIELSTYRDAAHNEFIDSKLVMGCLRTKEYKHLVSTYFDKLPPVSDFEMFEKCSEMIESIPCHDLQQLFLHEIESRKNSYANICMVQKELRQMCLSMNYNLENINLLNQRLEASII